MAPSWRELSAQPTEGGLAPPLGDLSAKLTEGASGFYWKGSPAKRSEKFPRPPLRHGFAVTPLPKGEAKGRAAFGFHANLLRSIS